MNLLVNKLNIVSVSDFIYCKILQLGILLLWSGVSLNNAILTPPKFKSIVESTSKKEKRGALGFGVHGHHGYAAHFDDWVPHHNHVPPPPPPPPHPPAHVNLGAHFHTTVTKKVGIPYPVPYPYPVKVSKHSA
jgi:hypothetical protein